MGKQTAVPRGFKIIIFYLDRILLSPVGTAASMLDIGSEGRDGLAGRGVDGRHRETRCHPVVEYRAADFRLPWTLLFVYLPPLHPHGHHFRLLLWLSFSDSQRPTALSVGAKVTEGTNNLSSSQQQAVAHLPSLPEGFSPSVMPEPTQKTPGKKGQGCLAVSLLQCEEKQDVQAGLTCSEAASCKENP